MRRPDDLIDSERAVLEELASTPGDARAVSERINQPYLEVWLTLARLMKAGYLEGHWDHDDTSLRRVYTITAKGRRAAEDHGLVS